MFWVFSNRENNSSSCPKVKFYCFAGESRGVKPMWCRSVIPVVVVVDVEDIEYSNMYNYVTDLNTKY